MTKSAESIARAIWVMVFLCGLLTFTAIGYMVFNIVRISSAATPPTQSTLQQSSSPIPASVHLKREYGRSEADLRDCLRSARAGCEKIVVLAFADAPPYTELTKSGWMGLEVELARIMAREIFGDDVDLTSKLQFVRANSPDDRLKLSANVDIDFSIGAITDDNKTGPDSRRHKFNIDFTRSFAADSYAILTKKGAQRDSTDFCDTRFFEPAAATFVELNGATGTSEKYEKFCEQEFGRLRKVRPLAAEESKPTTVGEAIDIVRKNHDSYFFSDAAIVSYRASQDSSLALIRKTTPDGEYRLGLVVRKDEGGWRALIEHSLENAKQRGKLAEVCSKYSKHFGQGKLLICSRTWS